MTVKYKPLSLEIESRAAITGSGLSLPADLSYDEWLGVGRKLMLADKAVQWAIGDWWIYGDHAYGERASAAIDPASGENRLQRYMDYGFVARAIETSRRREVLSWSAHREVAGLEPKIQDAILDRAVENGWRSREIRAAVREYKARLAEGNEPKLSAQTPDIEEAEIVEETDAAVFDATAAGAAMPPEERREVLDAMRETAQSTATERLNHVLALLKTMRNEPGFMAALDPQQVSAESCGIEGDWLKNVGTETRHRQNIEFDRRARKPAPAAVDKGRHFVTIDGEEIETAGDIPKELRRIDG